MIRFKTVWGRFNADILPRETPTKELKERKLMFYAGAFAMMNTMIAITDMNRTEEEIAQILEDLKNEVMTEL